MAKNVVGLFDDHDGARRAIDELTRLGFARESISVVAADQEGKFLRHRVEEGGNVAAEGAVTGLTSGAIVGGILGFLVGTGAIFIPGGVLAVGPIAGIITGAAAGAATGGVLGGLIGMGIPREHADIYAEGIRRGGVLVAITPEGREDEVEDVMRDCGAIDIEERAEEYRAEGFTSYDVDARPYTTEQGIEDRDQSHPSPAGTPAAAMGGERMEGLNANTMVPGNPPLGNSGIGRGTITTSYTGAAGSVGTGSVGLPSGAMGSADDDMQTRTDHMNVVGDVPDVLEDRRRHESGIGFTPAGIGVGMDEGGMAPAGGTGAPGNVPGTTPERNTAGADIGGPGTMGENVGQVPQNDFGTPGATGVTPTTAGTTGTMGQSVDVSKATTSSDAQNAPSMGGDEVGRDNTSGLPESSKNPNWRFTHMEDFRDEFDRTYGGRGMTYEQAVPAFEFGHQAWANERTQGQDWNAVEHNLRDEWEQRNPGTWIMFRDIVKTSWERSARSRRGAELL